MIPLSVVIITKNEAKNIKACLESVQWADEIVVLDSHSTDHTPTICRPYNCMVYETEWLGFGKTKHKAVELATNDWILSIDADEVLTVELIAEIKSLLQHEPFLKAYRIKRQSYYLGKMIKHCGWDRDYTLRLFDRRHGQFNDKPVHESVVTDGKIGLLQSIMLHYTYPDLSSHITKMYRYAELGAQSLYDKGMKSTPLLSVVRGISKFIKMYILQAGFLDGSHGFVLCVNSAWGVYLKYILLWEKWRTQ